MSFEVLRQVRKFSERAVELELNRELAEQDSLMSDPGPKSLMREGLPIEMWRALPDS
ncbi:hypothetical protein GV794_23525 [Nocardia cyriacigeorgica]|uniref:Uncharacterized protein n=1 Tax=Nocardia cyriacigeorgica TaxID=135487 RepID=A0ABX0CR45_9NOCA|nr:hypothetical protein [Nocardia cyriacigeorgica]NEW58591.1 hypothetical protein [Nocardia cyriacigeorgica]